MLKYVGEMLNESNRLFFFQGSAYTTRGICGSLVLSQDAEKCRVISFRHSLKAHGERFVG